MVPARSVRVSRVPTYSGYRLVSLAFAYGDLTLFVLLSQNSSADLRQSIMRSEPRNACTPVWPLSISLAATLKIYQATYFERLNNQERRVDALALRADERRDKLR